MFKKICINYERICINYLHKWTEFEYFCFFIDKISHSVFWKCYYLFLYEVYQFEHVLCKLAGRLSPILIKMVFWGGELPPLRKLKNNPWWLLNILVHDVINLLYDEHLTDKQKYFYVWNLLLQKLIHQLWLVIKDNLHLGISILSNT